MFIVLRKRSIKRNLIIASLLLLSGTSLMKSPPASAMTTEPSVVDVTQFIVSPFNYNNDEMKNLGIEKAGILSGIGKSTAYLIRQKTQWDMQVKQAYYRVELAKQNGKAPSRKDKALVDAEEKRKNPPKQNKATKVGGNFLSDIFAYYTSGSKSGDNPPDAKIIGGGLAAGGFLLLLKSFAPLAPLLL